MKQIFNCPAGHTIYATSADAPCAICEEIAHDRELAGLRSFKTRIEGMLKELDESLKPASPASPRPRKGTKPKSAAKATKSHRKSAKLLTEADVNGRLQPRHIKLIGTYSGYDKPATFECRCGHQWTVSAAAVLKGSGCGKCNGSRRLTPEEINRELEGSGIELAGEYVNARTLATFLCANGHTFEDKFRQLSKRRSCPCCIVDAGGKKKGRPLTTSSTAAAKPLPLESDPEPEPAAETPVIPESASTPAVKPVRKDTIVEEETEEEALVQYRLRELLCEGFDLAEMLTDPALAIIECSKGHKHRVNLLTMADDFKCSFCESRRQETPSYFSERLERHNELRQRVKSSISNNGR